MNNNEIWPSTSKGDLKKGPSKSIQATANKKKIILILVSILWAGLIMWGMFKVYKLSKQPYKKEEKVSPLPSPIKKVQPLPKEEKKSVSTPVLTRTFKVKRMDFKDTLPVMGTIKAKAEIPLKFEVSGVIKKIYFKEGELINKGDLIASLENKDATLKLQYTENKVLSAKSSYESLLKKLEIYKQLFEAGAIIETKLKEVELDVESAKAELEAAKTEREIAKEELKKTTLYATTEGLMGPKEAEEGEFVTPQDEIGSLLDISEVFVEAGIVERDINRVKAGMKTNISVDAYPNKMFTGVIERIYPIVEGKSRTFTAKIKVLNPQGLLLPGMFSRVEIFSVELEDALIVPAISLISTGEETFLLPVIPKETIEVEEEGTMLGTVKFYPTKIGYLSSDYAQILGGVKEGDLVVTEAQGDLNDNMRVRIVGVEEFSTLEK